MNLCIIEHNILVFLALEKINNLITYNKNRLLCFRFQLLFFLSNTLYRKIT